MRLVIDNFAPYVESVAVSLASIPDSPKYSAAWPGAVDENNLGGDLNPSPDELIGTTAPLKFKIEFSEEMDQTVSPTTKLKFANGQEPALPPGTWSNGGKTYTITTTSSTFASSAASGNAALSIEAKDLAGNPLDFNPKTIEHRDANGKFSANQQGPDKNHTVRIDAVAPVISLLGWYGHDRFYEGWESDPPVFHPADSLLLYQ